MRILLVEDDTRVASFIRRGLREESFAVDIAKDGDEALAQAESSDFDLLILDLMLPKRGGLEVLQTLRREGSKVPILILTAKDELHDRVAGLNAGADDYLTKPFGFEELLARVRALLRRKGDMISPTLRIHDLELDTVKHRATRSGKTIDLTSREFALLEFLMQHIDQVVTRTMLSEHVWEEDFDPMTNVIDVYVARLRRKIDDPYPTKLLRTLRGRGYMLQAPLKK